MKNLQKKFQSFINYKKLNEFINSDDNEKDYLIENNHKEFNKIYIILQMEITLNCQMKLNYYIFLIYA